MTVRQIESFLSAAEFGSFTAASEKLYLSVSTLSRYISALEEELGTTLFVRRGSAVVLSDAGALLREQFRVILESYNASVEQVHNTVAAFSSRLHIGLQSDQVLPHAVRITLQALQREHPEIRVQFGSLDLRASYAKLVSGGIDALLCLSSTVPVPDGFEALPLFTDRMCVCVPAGHPNAGMEEIGMDEIGLRFPELPFRMLDINEFEPSMHETLREGYERHYSSPENVLRREYCSMDNLRLSVEAGLCICINNLHSVYCTLPNVRLIPLRELESRPQVELIYRPDSTNRSLGVFLELLKKHA